MHRCGTIDTRSMRAEQARLIRARIDDVGQRILAVSTVDLTPSARTEQLMVELACIAEPRSSTTAPHLERIGRYVALLAGSLGWPEDRSEAVRLASMLHDVGKVGIPDAVLLNDGVFTREDRVIMERHTQIGHDLLRGTGADLLELGARVALSHHERVDGTGYPKGLRSGGIPIEGRIVAIADVFDALTTARRYKPAMNLIQARALMMANRGTHFDAALLDLFFDRSEELGAIRRLRVEPHRRARSRSSPGGG